MSDSTQQYILKQPAEASYYEEGLMAVEFEDMSECLIITDEQFENTFVLLDIPDIEKQVIEVLLKLESNSRVMWDVEGAVNEILGLFGLENKNEITERS